MKNPSCTHFDRFGNDETTTEGICNLYSIDIKTEKLDIDDSTPEFHCYHVVRCKQKKVQSTYASLCTNIL